MPTRASPDGRRQFARPCILPRQRCRLGGGGLCERQHHRDDNDRSGGLHLCASHLWCQAFLIPASRSTPWQRSKNVARSIHTAIESMPSFRNLMYAYVNAFLEQVMVSVACNGAHSLKQR